MILAVSYADDEHTSAVVERLRRAGREVALLDLSRFPSGGGLALDYRPGAAPHCAIDTDIGRIDASGCSVGWWRRVRPWTVDPAVRAPHERAFAASETEQAIGGLLDALPCAWVNEPSRDESAHRKTLQLAVAREVGLAVPRTLVTNDPAAAQRFLDAHPRAVCKAFLASADAWRAARLVDATDRERPAAVRFAPVIFQEYVAGVDLRVTVVGERLFAAEIDASRTSYPVDMRIVLGEARVRPVELPDPVARALLALMARLGLRYGAADLRRDAAGRHHFLEVNPAGQWLFADDRTGLPITAAVADLLAALDGALAAVAARRDHGDRTGRAARRRSTVCWSGAPTCGGPSGTSTTSPTRVSISTRSPSPSSRGATGAGGRAGDGASDPRAVRQPLRAALCCGTCAEPLTLDGVAIVERVAVVSPVP